MTARTPVHGDDTCTIQADMPTMLPQYYRARYYAQTMGRFVSEDPLGFIAGPDFYVYASNAPVDSNDPTGLCDNCNVRVPKHLADADIMTNMIQSHQNRIIWWYIMVAKGHGPWDYKYYHGIAHNEYDDFGNFNYGATGCVLGIPLNILLRGAGFAKQRLLGPNDPHGSPLGRYPYGNQPDKQKQVIDGFNYCTKCWVPPDYVDGP
jgi:RHS repeat-associated protein